MAYTALWNANLTNLAGGTGTKTRTAGGFDDDIFMRFETVAQPRSYILVPIEYAADGSQTTTSSEYFTERYRVSSFPSVDIPILKYGTASSADFRGSVVIKATTGAIVARNESGTESSSAGTVPLNEWFEIRFRWVSGGNIEVGLNGGSTVTVASSAATAPNSINIGIINTDAEGNTTYVVDVSSLVAGTQWAPAGYKVVCLKPDADGGDASGWSGGTGSGFGDVNNFPSDTDTTYWQAINGTNKRSVQFGSLPADADVVLAIQAGADVREVTTTTSTFQLYMDDGTEATTSSRNAGTSYEQIRQIRETMPDGGALTVADVNTLEVGVIHGAVNVATNPRCTRLELAVLYEETVLQRRRAACGAVAHASGKSATQEARRASGGTVVSLASKAVQHEARRSAAASIAGAAPRAISSELRVCASGSGTGGAAKHLVQERRNATAGATSGAASEAQVFELRRAAAGSCGAAAAKASAAECRSSSASSVCSSAARTVDLILRHAGMSACSGAGAVVAQLEQRSSAAGASVGSSNSHTTATARCCSAGAASAAGSGVQARELRGAASAIAAALASPVAVADGRGVAASSSASAASKALTAEHRATASGAALGSAAEPASIEIRAAAAASLSGSAAEPVAVDGRSSSSGAVASATSEALTTEQRAAASGAGAGSGSKVTSLQLSKTTSSAVTGTGSSTQTQDRRAVTAAAVASATAEPATKELRTAAAGAVPGASPTPAIGIVRRFAAAVVGAMAAAARRLIVGPQGGKFGPPRVESRIVTGEPGVED